MNIKEIATAWKNVVYSSQEIKEVAKVRMTICDSCENKKKILNLVVCGLCHCPLKAKTKSNENSCPAKKWVR